MEFNIRVWALGFSSIAIGALALLALCLGMAKGSRQVRLALVLTCFSAICVLATHGPFALLVLREATGWQWPFWLRWPFIVMGETIVALLWLSVMVLFEDRRMSPVQFAPAVLLTAISSLSTLNVEAGVAGVSPVGWLAVPVNLALGAHALVCVARGWRGDLVEKRRRLRRPFLLVLGLVLTLVLMTQGAEFVAQTSKADMTGAFALLNVALAVMALTTGALFLEPRVSLLAEPAPAPPKEPDHSGDDAVLTKLEALMNQGEVWRREGLSVGELAEEGGVPEHRLRVLINGRLGHRNFAAFINARRIDAARQRLADRVFADTPVSKIAYDLGFASLGPFNRAFKDATGVTPTEWRRSHLPSAAG